MHGRAGSVFGQQVNVQSLELAPEATLGYVQWPTQDRALQEWRHPKWAMRAYRLDFRRSDK